MMKLFLEEHQQVSQPTDCHVGYEVYSFVLWKMAKF